MTTINATALRKDLFTLLRSTVKYNDRLNVTTKEGNAVIISEEEYEGLLATIELSSDKLLKDKLLAGKAEEIGNCLNIDEIDW